MPENMPTCDCSDEFGPCENHADYLVIREGASLHTADELTLLLVSDLLDCGATLDERDTDEYERLSALLITNENPTSGTAWFDDGDESGAAQYLADKAQDSAGDIGLWVIADDGYVIVRPHAGCPLLDN